MLRITINILQGSITRTISITRLCRNRILNKNSRLFQKIYLSIYMYVDNDIRYCVDLYQPEKKWLISGRDMRELTQGTVCKSAAVGYHEEINSAGDSSEAKSPPRRCFLAVVALKMTSRSTEVKKRDERKVPGRFPRRREVTRTDFSVADGHCWTLDVGVEGRLLDRQANYSERYHRPRSPIVEKLPRSVIFGAGRSGRLSIDCYRMHLYVIQPT